MKLLKKHLFNETRILLTDDDNRPVRLFVARDAALNLGETVTGTITARNTTLRGYFVMTAKNLSVFVPSADKKSDGESVLVQITKEARLGKDATGRFVDVPEPYRFEQMVMDETGVTTIAEWTDDTDEVIESALNNHISFADGATLHIERTNACWTIDIDSGNSTLPLTQINREAVPVIAEQIILKNLSGIILIDFAGFKSDEDQYALHTAIKKHLKTDKRSSLYGFSKTHLYEIKRGRAGAALADIFLTPDGHWNIPATVYRIRQALAQRKNPTAVWVHAAILPHLQNKIPAHIQLKPNFNCEQDYFEIIGD